MVGELVVWGPLREVEEGVTIGVGGDSDDVAEGFGDGFEREGGVVRGATRWFVVEVP